MRKEKSLQVAIFKLKDKYLDISDIYNSRFSELKKHLTKVLDSNKTNSESNFLDDINSKILAFKECINQIKELVDSTVSLEIIDEELERNINMLDTHINKEKEILEKVKSLYKDLIKISSTENTLYSQVKSNFKDILNRLENSVKQTNKLRKTLFEILEKKERLIKTAGEYV